MALRFIVLAILASILDPGPAMGQTKPRVAVIDFRDSKGKSEIENNLGTRQDLGRKVSTMLQTQLAGGGLYRVLETGGLEKIEKEQNFSNSDRFDTAAAKLTALLGADLMIVGEVNVSRTVEKDAAARVPNSSAGSGKPTTVKVSARLIQVKSDEILASANGVGIASSLKESSIERALERAVSQLAANLNKKAPLVHGGQIADFSNGEVILNVGSEQSLKVGDTVSVLRAPLTIRDPESGPTHRLVESELGTVKITSVDSRSAAGTFSGDVNPKVGDSLRWLSSKQANDDNAARPRPGRSPASVPPSSVPSQNPPSRPPRRHSMANEYRFGDELEKWKKTLKAGAVEYRVPGQMTASVPATVTVNLHGYQDLQTRALPEATGTGTLQVSSFMKVELFAPFDPGEFTIHQSSGEAVQFIPNDGYATWMWSVTPAHAAPSEMLQIRISLVHRDGTAAVEPILAEKTYNVTVNVEKLSVTLKHSFWKDPIAWFRYMLPGGAGWGAAAALFAWIGGLALWKNRRKTSKRAAK